MIFRKSVLLLAVVSIFLPPASAQQVAHAQIAAGHELALSVCGACHVVTQDQSDSPILRNPAPSFVSIVNQPAFSVDVFRQYLGSKHPNLGPHETMPNPELVDYQIDEIVAYVLSLKAASVTPH